MIKVHTLLLNTLDLSFYRQTNNLIRINCLDRAMTKVKILRWASLIRQDYYKFGA